MRGITDKKQDHGSIDQSCGLIFTHLKFTKNQKTKKKTRKKATVIYKAFKFVSPNLFGI